MNYVDEARAEAGYGLDSARPGASTAARSSTCPPAFDMTDRTSLFASVTNLTDQDYNVAFRPAGARPGAPRSWLAGVRFAF